MCVCVCVCVCACVCVPAHFNKWVECSPMVWETWVQSQVASYQRLYKWYLIPPCLKTQQYKVRIKGKVEQSRERSSVLLYTSV